MPPKSKKQQLYERRALTARLGKANKGDSAVVSDFQPNLTAEPESATAEGASSTETTETEDPSVHSPTPEDSEDPNVILEQFIEEWVMCLGREDTISLSLFLTYHFVKLFNFTKTKAAEYAGMMIRKTDCSVRQWKQDFLDNKGIPDNKQGKYQRTGVLWSSEELNWKATKYVRENANVKGQPNMTSLSFCRWVNDDLQNTSLPPGFPRRVSIQTARKWLHHLGFIVLSGKQGIFFDGHKHDDVVAERVF